MSVRSRFLLLALACVPLGLATRPLKRVADALGSALGDALWALLVFFLVCAGFSKWPLSRRIALALAIAFFVEVSQLWHTSWLDTLRHTTLGALAIGGSFSFGDLACYSVGIALGALLTQRFEAELMQPQSTF